MASPPRLLLEGRPGIGKTTVVKKLLTLLAERGIPATGFTTGELRERGRRVGFSVETIDGRRATLAHLELPGPPWVGRYGVDVAAFEETVAGVLTPESGAVIVIDELGKMELASARFCADVGKAFAIPSPAIVATVHAARHPVTDALKARSDVELLRVTVADRDGLPARLAERLAEWAAGHSAGGIE